MKSFKLYIKESLLDDEDELASDTLPLVKEFLKKNNKLKEEIETKVREHYGILKNEKKETTKKSDD